MQRTFFFFAILILAGLTIVACGDTGEPSSSGSLDSARSVEPGTDGGGAEGGGSGDLVANGDASTGQRAQVFWIHTSWCGNCKKLEPTWEELVASHGDAIQMVVVDRDSKEGNDFARSHGIHYQPGFVVYDSSGELVYEGLGPYDPEELEALVLNLD